MVSMYGVLRLCYAFQDIRYGKKSRYVCHLQVEVSRGSHFVVTFNRSTMHGFTKMELEDLISLL